MNEDKIYWKYFIVSKKENRMHEVLQHFTIEERINYEKGLLKAKIPFNVEHFAMPEDNKKPKVSCK